MVPGEGDAFRCPHYLGGLFGEGRSFPGEFCLLTEFLAVGGEALFGYAAAEWVVEVTPGSAVRGYDGGEAALGVPGVVPGVGFAGEAGFSAEGYSAELVMFVADGAGFGDVGAGVDAVASG